jgi:hypothetical protein
VLRDRLLNARFDLWSRHVAATKRPIMLGPWTSEIGFEALYWLPFIDWWREKYHIDKSRLVAIGRGGSAVWYGAGATADIYDHVPVQDVRLQTWMRAKTTGSVKQNTASPWDAHICGLVAASLNISRYHVLHPSWMYRLLAPFWTDEQSIKYLHARTRFTRLPPPVLPPGMELPPKFVAVRFYARPTFIPGEDTVLWAQGLVERMAQTQPVILLHSGGHYDDHADLVQPVPGKVFALPPLNPSENVAVLSAVLGRASAFVGTYGGFAQLALRLGVPSVSVWSQWGSTALGHLALSHVLSTVSGVPFMAGTPAQVDHFISTLGRGPAPMPQANVLP